MLYILLGAMNRITSDQFNTSIYSSAKSKAQLSISSCLQKYFDYRDSNITIDASAFPHDGFAEMMNTVHTVDSYVVQKYFHAQLFAVRHDGTLKGSTASAGIVDTKLIPPNRSGLTWSMMSQGSPLFLLDSGDEIILYRYLFTLQHLFPITCSHFCFLEILLIKIRKKMKKISRQFQIQLKKNRKLMCRCRII